MNKKGGHVDWVISMGIFITYIFALFILLRPGIKPIYRPETLLDNLQARFDGNVTWIIKKVPLFVKVCSPGSEVGADGQAIPTILGVDDTGEGDWSVSRVMLDGEDFNDPFPLKCDGTEDRYYGGEVFDVYLKQGGESYDPKLFPKLEVECRPDDLTYCEAELGIAEDIEGINPSWLRRIKSADYKALKENWDFPESKEFAIFEDENKIIGEEPYAKANVFVRGIKTQEITSEGRKNPVTIYFKTW